LVKTKATLEEAERGKATNDSLTRKIKLLEDELDTAEKNLKEAVEKCVFVCLLARLCRASEICGVADSDRWISRRSISNVRCSVSNKSAMSGRGGMRYVLRPPMTNRPADCAFRPRPQEMEAKHRKAKAELDDLVANMEGL